MQRCGGQRGCEHKLNTEISHSSGGFRLETLGYVFDVPFFVQCSPGQTLILSYSKTMVFAVFSPAPGSWVRPLNVSSAAMIVCAELSPGVFELQSSPPAEGGDEDSTTVLSRNGPARNLAVLAIRARCRTRTSFVIYRGLVSLSDCDVFS